MGINDLSYKQNTAIIIPSLNPDDKLLMLLRSLKENGYMNLILVNDGSSEKYNNYFETAKASFGCKVLLHSVNLGKGRAIKTAFNYILTECPDCIGAVTVDSDGQHRLDDIIKCSVATVENKDALILGCRDFYRKSDNVPFRSKFGNIITRNVLKILCGINLTDTQTGLRGFSRDLMKKFLTTKGERFEFEMNMILETKENGISIKEVPIKTVYIEDNRTSHFNPLKDSLRIYALFIKFVISSLSSFLIDISLFTLFVVLHKNIFPNFAYYIFMSTVGARILSAIFNYTMNKKTVFKHNSSSKSTFFKYLLLFSIQLSISAISVYLLYDLTGINESLIKFVVDSLLFLITFQIQREWVFKNA